MGLKTKRHLINQNEPAKIVEEVGERLQSKYGKEPIPTSVIQREIERLGSYARGSVLPSDYCYNLLNRSPYSFKYPVFIRTERGRLWKPQNGKEKQVGRWNAGKCNLDEDPRT
jgi:hypothetical protein